MKAFKTFEVCPLDQKPDLNIPDHWPWIVSDIEQEQAADYLANGYQVMTAIDFDNYLATYQDDYDAWFATWDAEQKTTEAYKKFTIKERREWAENLMEELKLMNIEAGVNLAQSLWMHNRLRCLSFTVASGHVATFPPLAPLQGLTINIDFLNLVISGDVETAYAALICATPDDMSEPYHVFNAELIGFIKTRIEDFLGW